MAKLSVASTEKLDKTLQNATKSRDKAWDEFFAAVERPSVSKMPLRELMFRWEKMDDLVKDLQARLERAERQTP
jgi:hypothetical protein